MSDYYIGLDIGTSGCRACAIDESLKQVAYSRQSMPRPELIRGRIQQEPNIWWQTVELVLNNLLERIDPAKVRAIAIDGTSGSVLITDQSGQPLAPALMYNDVSCIEQAKKIARIAPETSAAQGPSSGLAKLIWLQQAYPKGDHFLHQADWIAGKFMDQFGLSDENNGLKSGYDPLLSSWPDWLDQLGLARNKLPRVLTPGEVMGQICPIQAEKFHLDKDVQIIAGTTDSIAAFMAAGANQPGDAVTSLGSSLVLKVVSAEPVYSAKHGIYSHRLGDYWLAGGASNTGGAVLLKYFSAEQIESLSRQLKPEQATGLNYYPLLHPGERFPVNDPKLPVRLTPRPNDDVIFFQAMLEAMANIEHQGYQKLAELGAEYPSSVVTVGGGSYNSGWRDIRHNILGVPVYTAQHNEACYGTALLAKQAH